MSRNSLDSNAGGGHQDPDSDFCRIWIKGILIRTTARNLHTYILIHSSCGGHLKLPIQIINTVPSMLNKQ